jgi:GTPase KRas protein
MSPLVKRKHKKKYIPTYKLILLGSGGVGKTALLHRYLYRTFSPTYTPTLSDTFTQKVAIDATTECNLEVLDTAGQEELAYGAVRENALKQVDGFMICFGVDERAGWEQAIAIRDQVCRVLNDDHPMIVLVGNKIDILDRQVERQKSMDLVRRWGKGAEYVEASAKEDKNVIEVFDSILRRIDQVHEEKMETGESEEALTCCTIG